MTKIKIALDFDIQSFFDLSYSAGGGRTHTMLPSEDFKSSASANSATAPCAYNIITSIQNLSIG